ncbi:hypothetical protein GCM10012279_09490 [Micromonospora yangpuensis]|nr:hypothetical protein GCM10012279_09490 [Micromonospora yangpuensis]
MVFADVDAAGVGDAVGVGVLGGVGAAVVVAVVVEAADHAAFADAAVQEAGQDVVAAAGPGFPDSVGASAGGGDQGLGAVESVVVDEGFVGQGCGVDPFVAGVPALFGFVSEGDVVDVDEDLGLALLVPDLPAGVAGVGEDDPDGAFAPRGGGAVWVAARVVGRGGEDAVAGESFGDGEEAVSGEVLGVDASDDVCGEWVGFEAVQPSAVGCFCGVGVWAGVGEAVAVGLPPRNRPSVAAWAAMALRTRTLMRLRSPLLMPP